MQTGAKITLEGIVQGVGFRPFVHCLATSFNLSGWTLNSSSGVIIEVEGDEEMLDGFYKELLNSPPPLANIIKKSIEYHAPLGLKSFEIKESQSFEDEFTPVSPDIGICKDCHRELLDPNDRRYRYPFINCTNCGPRFTIIQDIPYDRQMTTMEKFKMCEKCLAEYEDIANRKYHAQPNACPVCGPRIWLSRDGKEVECADPIKETIDLLRRGCIVAVKGLGGFHLACNAQDDEVVKRLRERKRREKSKPLAIMSPGLKTIKKYCEVSPEEEQLLTGPQKPIVLLKKLKDSPVAESVAPNNNYLGIMLPYTPLHYLLMDDPEMPSLVMTSANLSDEPLTKDNPEAEKRLSEIADYILMHNRDIYNRCDDSLARVVGKQEVVIRRSRGYAPFPVWLDFELKRVLGVGAELKNTFCLTRGNLAFLSQHIGDLKNLETSEFFKEGIERYKRLFRIEPEAIAYDLHPDYLSTKFALELATRNSQPVTFGIQHHHAHIASAMAENGVDERVIGVAMDGTGFGTDGNIWGCEFLLADYLGLERAAHLKYIPMPGGDKAIEEPYRMAISFLYAAYGDKIPQHFLKRWRKEKLSFILKMIERGINSPLASSTGRLFDAVSSILGLRDVVDYEAQAAIELEMIADYKEEGVYGFEVFEEEGVFIIDHGPIILDLVQDIDRQVAPSILSSRFHNTVADFTLDICKRIRDKEGVDKVVLSGGVFQNRYLLERVKTWLGQEDFIPILHSRVPPNDGGISLGQAVIASKKMENKEAILR